MPQPQLTLNLIATDELSSQVPLVLPVSGGDIPAAFASAARIARFTAKPEETLRLVGDAVSHNAQREVLLVGVGGAAGPEAAGAYAAAALCAFPQIAIDGRGLSRSVAVGLALGAALRAWRFPNYRQGAQDRDGRVMEISRIDLVVDNPARIGSRWQEAANLVEAVSFARNLVAEPSNVLTPAIFIDRLRALEAVGIEVEVIPGKDLAPQGLNLLAAVGRGSVNPPALVLLHWAGTLALPPVAFIGKGITFDTGGISIKPAHRMWSMRGDMAGAAVCAGAMLALAKRSSPAPVTAVLALAENMIGADSYRPGDVVRSHHGLTVEIVDTDAEGRLVLADALSFAIARLKPRAVVDLATLT
jgi:leucyl aminopeptidase